MRVLVCGGRDFEDAEFVARTLSGVVASRISQGDTVTVVHGMCPTGADKHADTWARANRIAINGFRALWDKHGKAAGPIRNQRMIDKGAPDLVVAFPGGRGTADMVRRAREAGVEVMEAHP